MCGVIKWGMSNLQMTTSQRKVILPSPVAISCHQCLRYVCGIVCARTSNCRDFMEVIVGNHIFCEFMCVTAMSCSEISYHQPSSPSSGSYILSSFSSAGFPGPCWTTFDTDNLSKAKHSQSVILDTWKTCRSLH